MKNSALYYSIGPLLYCPANRTDIVSSIVQEKFGRNYSLALCLEDTINDRFVTQAEEILIHSLQQIYTSSQSLSFFIPKIFVRVRCHTQMKNLLNRLGEPAKILSGFILPKFDPANAGDYIRTALEINQNPGKIYYIMPIMESPAIIDLKKRADILYEIKEKLALIEKFILNIRVGGNDLCHAFGFRRHQNESIHEILPIAGIFSDIITVFGRDYVISGPVWEYYSGQGWEEGLRRELAADRLIGFTGKTVIHPRQIPAVRQAYAVSAEDLNDAKTILNWDDNSASLVSGNSLKHRMNECKTHANWAEKIIYLSEIYGIDQSVPVH